MFRLERPTFRRFDEPALDPFTRRGGIYVVQFPDCVKVGRAAIFTVRVPEYLRRGGTSFIAYATPLAAGVDMRTVEARVLQDVRDSGAHHVRGVEWFGGRTYEQIAWTVERSLYRQFGTVELAASVTRESR